MLKANNVSVLVFLLIFVACKTNTSDKSTTNFAPINPSVNDTVMVETVFVEQANFYTETWCNGTLQAGQKAIVPFELQGNLVNVYVRNGQWVDKGQLLAQIDDYRQQHALTQAEINHRQAIINYNDQLLLSGNRAEDTANISSHVKEGARLRSGLLQALLELNKAQRELENTTITAPVSGVVAGLTAQAYTPTSEYKNFCTLLNTREMVVNFDVLEHDAALIKPGVAIELLPVAMEGVTFSGSISSADPMLSKHGSLNVSALVPNPKGLLIDGMKVMVVVKTSIPNQVVIHKTAVLSRQNRQVVFTVEDGRAMWNYVVTGYENSTHYTITEGLQPGQQVIVSNNLTIGHQAPVLVSNPLK